MVTLFSEGAETLLGYRAEEVIGRGVALLYGGEAGAHEVLREMHKRGGTVSGFEGVAWAKDGSAIPVLISASLLFDDDGREIGTVGFATDLRERKRGEEAVQKAYDELEKRVEERTLELREARGTPAIPAHRHARHHVHEPSVRAISPARSSARTSKQSWAFPAGR